MGVKAAMVTGNEDTFSSFCNPSWKAETVHSDVIILADSLQSFTLHKTGQYQWANSAAGGVLYNAINAADETAIWSWADKVRDYIYT